MRDGDDKITEVIRHHWDRRANTFDDEVGHGLASEEQRRAWHDLLSRLAGSAPRRALDVGCGTGFLALRLAELGHTASGIDLALRVVERYYGRDESYDLVVARHVIWNLPDPERGVSEWLRVLSPGGKLALIEGKWADNEALALSLTRPTSRLAHAIRRGAARVLGKGDPNRRYHGIEAQLPFSGGPSAERLASFLQANGLVDVVVEPLMDPTLWGEMPQFPRYVVVGSRSLVTEPRS